VQVKELALSAICNVAAGSQHAKQQMCEAGIIAPVLAMLKPDEDCILTQLASLALRNLSRNTASRQEIIRLGGVSVLLAFLGQGLEQLQFPLQCEVGSMTIVTH
jgi:Armadillo/beta-catenin-like repeat